MKKHEHYFERDDSPCVICGKTVSELLDEESEKPKPKKIKKKKPTKKKISYLDYQCMIGEKVQWNTITNEHFEGRLLKMDENSLATVLLDDGTEITYQC
jgi:hypothetical protein